MNNRVTTNNFLGILLEAWSIESSTQWIETKPAKGQCGATSLVVHDYFGGANITI